MREWNILRGEEFSPEVKIWRVIENYSSSLKINEKITNTANSVK